MQCNFMESHGFKGRMRFMSIKRKLLAILGTFCAIILLMTGITYFRGSSMLYALLSEAGMYIIFPDYNVRLAAFLRGQRCTALR